MKLTDNCIHCLLSRVKLECSLAGATPKLELQITKECQKILEDLKNSDLLHPQIAGHVHRHACSRIGNPDPFKVLKDQGNKEAISVCRKVRHQLISFRERVLASVIANTFDYGVMGHIVSGDFGTFFEHEFPKGLFIDDTGTILKQTNRVVYLTDNCGEIVFDRLVVEFLKKRGSHITVAVRDAAILNDATMDDALSLKFDRIVDQLTTTGGNAEIGIDLEKIPQDLRDAIHKSTLIIAKGMANYESLSMYKKLPPVAFLMAVKCKPIADDIGVPIGSKIALLQR